MDGESALFVDNFSNLVTDLLAEEHQVDNGVGSQMGMRETADLFTTDWIDSPVSRWQRAQPIDEDLSADLKWQLVDERAGPIYRRSEGFRSTGEDATHEGKMLVHSRAGNLGPDDVVGRLEYHVNEFVW